MNLGISRLSIVLNIYTSKLRLFIHSYLCSWVMIIHVLIGFFFFFIRSDKNKIKEQRLVGWLVGLFYGILTLEGYLTPNHIYIYIYIYIYTAFPIINDVSLFHSLQKILEQGTEFTAIYLIYLNY